MPHSSHNGRVALVTGSSTGLGKTIALALGRAGAQVVLNYRNNEKRAHRTFDEFQQAGGRGILVRADVTDPQDVERMIGEARESLGPIDILVCNATPDQPQRSLEEYDWEFYQQMLDFFVKSPYLLIRGCLRDMKSRRWGRIVNITSEVFQIGVAPFSAYVAAKGAQVGLSRSLAREFAPFGITVNMVAPGWIPVERHEKDPQELKDQYLARIPMGRWGTPHDVAAAVVYLTGEEAGFVTGQTITINGGHTVH